MVDGWIILSFNITPGNSSEWTLHTWEARCPKCWAMFSHTVNSLGHSSIWMFISCQWIREFLDKAEGTRTRQDSFQCILMWAVFYSLILPWDNILCFLLFSSPWASCIHSASAALWRWSCSIFSYQGHMLTMQSMLPCPN